MIANQKQSVKVNIYFWKLMDLQRLVGQLNNLIVKLSA